MYPVRQRNEPVPPQAPLTFKHVSPPPPFPYPPILKQSQWLPDSTGRRSRQWRPRVSSEAQDRSGWVSEHIRGVKSAASEPNSPKAWLARPAVGEVQELPAGAVLVIRRLPAAEKPAKPGKERSMLPRFFVSAACNSSAVALSDVSTSQSRSLVLWSKRVERRAA
jgi:hypothetical protein